MSFDNKTYRNILPFVLLLGVTACTFGHIEKIIQMKNQWHLTPAMKFSVSEEQKSVLMAENISGHRTHFVALDTHGKLITQASLGHGTDSLTKGKAGQYWRSYKSGSQFFVESVNISQQSDKSQLTLGLRKEVPVTSLGDVFSYGRFEVKDLAYRMGKLYVLVTSFDYDFVTYQSFVMVLDTQKMQWKKTTALKINDHRRSNRVLEIDVDYQGLTILSHSSDLNRYSLDTYSIDRFGIHLVFENSVVVAGTDSDFVPDHFASAGNYIVVSGRRFIQKESKGYMRLLNRKGHVQDERPAAFIGRIRFQRGDRKDEKFQAWFQAESGDSLLSKISFTGEF